ncbi:hypothetical protein INT48_007222 [Thamnidium elegans]|uniref:Uncharacterized protein n=1 Tax=Thamnidium elegans TaxID=101142 RepID=A0A8H7SQH1_9FUNG|nr:hypothetical protein INT48_007222 [Thamnidium elegans]
MSWNTKTWSWVKKYFSINPLSTDGMPVVGKFRTPAPASQGKYVYPKSKASAISNNPYFKRDTRRNFPRLAVYTQNDVALLLEGGQVNPSLTAEAAADKSVATIAEAKPLVEVLNSQKLYTTSKLAPAPRFGPQVTWKESTDFVPPNDAEFRPYMDQRQSLLDEKVLKGDHSFNIVKKMNKSNGVSNYSCMYTVMNVYEEIKMQILASTKSLKHVVPSSTNMMESYNKYGFELSELLYTDNVISDQVMSSLMDNVKHLNPTESEKKQLNNQYAVQPPAEISDHVEVFTLDTADGINRRAVAGDLGKFKYFGITGCAGQQEIVTLCKDKYLVANVKLVKTLILGFVLDRYFPEMTLGSFEENSVVLINRHCIIKRLLADSTVQITAEDVDQIPINTNDAISPN